MFSPDFKISEIFIFSKEKVVRKSQKRYSEGYTFWINGCIMINQMQILFLSRYIELNCTIFALQNIPLANIRDRYNTYIALRYKIFVH